MLSLLKTRDSGGEKLICTFDDLKLACAYADEIGNKFYSLSDIDEQYKQHRICRYMGIYTQ
jgi:hypothetical protein